MAETSKRSWSVKVFGCDRTTLPGKPPENTVEKEQAFGMAFPGHPNMSIHPYRKHGHRTNGKRHEKILYKNVLRRGSGVIFRKVDIALNKETENRRRMFPVENMEKNEHNRKTAQLIAKAWSDPAFKARLVTDPKAVLRAEGFDIPDGLEIRVLENTENLRHLVLPALPGELTDEQLERVAGAESPQGGIGFIGGGFIANAGL